MPTCAVFHAWLGGRVWIEGGRQFGRGRRGEWAGVLVVAVIVVAVVVVVVVVRGRLLGETLVKAGCARASGMSLCVNGCRDEMTYV